MKKNWISLYKIYTYLRWRKLSYIILQFFHKVFLGGWEKDMLTFYYKKEKEVIEGKKIMYSWKFSTKFQK